MRRIRLIILFLYVAGIGAFILKDLMPDNVIIFSCFVIFQFFVPGLTFGSCFGLMKRTFAEVVLYSFIISYAVYLITALPTLIFKVEWRLFINISLLIYFLIFILFLFKTRKKKDANFLNIQKGEIFIVIFAAVVSILFTYINFRSDASYYNNRISASVQSDYIERHNYNWDSDAKGQLVRIKHVLFHHEYKPFFNFLSMPVKVYSFDQRYAWFLFNKIFIFLSIIAVYCLGRGLYGNTCGYFSLLFFMVAVFIMGYYYGKGNIQSTGVLFAQAAYPRHVSENIFLLAFYLSLIEAFKVRSSKTFLFTGFILFEILSIHYYAFFIGVMNFVAFSLIIFIVRSYTSKNMVNELIRQLKNVMYVALFSLIYLLLLTAFSSYLQEFIHYQNDFQANYPGYSPAYLADKTFLKQCLTLINKKGNILTLVSLLIGIPLLIFKLKRKVSISVLFLLSNISVYLLLKFPLHNTVFKLHGAVAKRIDGSILFFIIAAVIVVSIGRKLNCRDFYMRCGAAVISVLIFIVFGTNNSFATNLRYRHNAGHVFLKMTQYYTHLKNSATSGISVFTNHKTAVDIYAFLNGYVFQYDSKAYWPFTITHYKKDLEKLFSFPYERSEKVVAFLDNQKFTYIIVPTDKTPYLGEKMASNLKETLGFYNKLKAYECIYSDRYYYVYKRK